MYARDEPDSNTFMGLLIVCQAQTANSQKGVESI